MEERSTGNGEGRKTICRLPLMGSHQGQPTDCDPDYFLMTMTPAEIRERNQEDSICLPLIIHLCDVRSNFLPVQWPGEPLPSASRLRRSDETPQTISLSRVIREFQGITPG